MTKDSTLIPCMKSLRQTTKTVVEGAEGFCTTVIFVLRDKRVFYPLIEPPVRGDEVETVRSKMLRFFTFGNYLSTDSVEPECVVVAELLVKDADKMIVVLSGYSNRGEQELTGFEVTWKTSKRWWKRSRRLKVLEGDDLEFVGDFNEYNPAAEVFRGLEQARSAETGNQSSLRRPSH